MSDPQGGHGAAPAGTKASPVRLVVLLAILALLVGALAFDWFVAKPGVEAADLALKTEAEKNNAVGFDSKLEGDEKQKKLADSLFDSADVQRILKKSPARTIKGDGYAIEVYRWWGYVPLSRHYMSVVYLGSGTNLRYSTHYVNSPAPADSLPGYERPVGPDPNAPAGVAAATAAGNTGGGGVGAPAGKGDGGKGGKGKGGKGKGGMKGPPQGDRPPSEPGADATPPSETKTDENKPAKEDDKGAKEDDAAAKEADKPAAEKSTDEKSTDEKSTDEKSTDEKKPETKSEE